MQQYWAYENLGAGKGSYPLLVNLQHPVANVLKHVLVAPLVERVKLGAGKLPIEICPVLSIQGKEYAVMMHLSAGIPEKQVGEPMADLNDHRTALRDALDFFTNGY